MDAEWERQFEDHKKRLKELTELILENNPDSSNDFINEVRGVVKETVNVKSNVSKLAAIMDNVISEVDGCENKENVKINEIYQVESEKDVEIPNFNYEEEFEQFLTSLKQDNDNEIMTQASQSVAIDPWTKKPIEVPVRSRICGHLYERSSVQELFKLKGNKLRCPYIGCKVGVKECDLIYE